MSYKLFLLCTLTAIAQANYQKSYQPEYSKEHKEEYQAPPSPYNFEYSNRDENGTVQFRKEKSDGKGRVEGQYGYKDPYGIERTVIYVADENGYRAQIKTNEPGTESKSPAAVDLFASSMGVQYQPSYPQMQYTKPETEAIHKTVFQAPVNEKQFFVQRIQQQSLPSTHQHFSQSSVKSHDRTAVKDSRSNYPKVQLAVPMEYAPQQIEAPKVQQEATPIEFMQQQVPFRQVIPTTYTSQKSQFQEAIPQQGVITTVQEQKVSQMPQPTHRQFFFGQTKSNHHFSQKRI